jgi:hypothetical protein
MALEILLLKNAQKRGKQSLKNTRVFVFASWRRCTSFPRHPLKGRWQGVGSGGWQWQSRCFQLWSFQKSKDKSPWRSLWLWLWLLVFGFWFLSTAHVLCDMCYLCAVHVTTTNCAYRYLRYALKWFPASSPLHVPLECPPSQPPLPRGAAKTNRRTPRTFAKFQTYPPTSRLFGFLNFFLVSFWAFSR